MQRDKLGHIPLNHFTLAMVLRPHVVLSVGNEALVLTAFVDSPQFGDFLVHLVVCISSEVKAWGERKEQKVQWRQFEESWNALGWSKYWTYGL